MAEDEVVIAIKSKDETKKGIKDAENSFKGLSSTVTKLAAAGFGVVAIKGFAEAMFDANVEAQKLNASLVSVTGSQEAATRAFKNLREFASKTPFQLNQVVEAFIKMKSLGLDATEEALMSFGNTASAMGKDLNQMIEAVADASTGEFERLKEFGIKASKEGDKITFTFQGVKTTVDNSAESITDFLKTIGDNKFGDAMSEQMKTLGGSVSNLSDNWNTFLVALGESGVAALAAGFITQLSTAINDMNEALDPTIQGRITDLADEIKALDQEIEALEGQFGFGGEAGQAAREEAISGIQSLINIKQLEIDALREERTKEKEKAAEEAGALGGGAGGTGGDITESPELEQLTLNLATREELERQSQEQMLADLMTNEEKRLEFLRSIEEEKLAIRKEFDDQLTDFEKTGSDLWLAKLQEEVEVEKRAADTIAQNKITAEQAAMDVLGSLSNLMNSESKAAFEVGKAASLAQATVNTYQAATGAYASLAGTGPYGPALGAAAAAAAVAAGLANVKKISETTFGGGGSGGGGGGGDFGGGAGPSGAGAGSGPELTQLTQPDTPGQPPQLPPIVIEGGGIMGKLMEDEIFPEINKLLGRGFELNLS